MDEVEITILKTNTPYPSRKIRRIRACTHQRPQRNKAQYAVSTEDQYSVLEIWNEYNILEDIKRGDRRSKGDEDKEIVELQSLVEVIPDEEEVAVDAIPLATKPPSIVDWKILKEGKISYFQIIRADGSLKRYSAFIQMLKSFDREDLKTLWRLVKAKHGYTRPEEGYERVLWGDLKVMFEPHVEDAVWRNLQGNKVLGRIVRIKSLLDDLEVTAAQVRVTAAKHELLMLLVQKLLLLVLKVNAAGIKVTTAKRLQLLEDLLDDLEVTAAQVRVTAAKHELLLLLVIPSRRSDAKVAIQEMAEYSQKWHNGTSRSTSIEIYNGLAAIQAQLNNLGREIKKVNEKVYDAQVGCEQCKGHHYTKDCLLKQEGKTLKEAYYMQFGGPFQEGRYRVAAPRFYQRNNANPLYQ
ncbi:hypothetical protein Tco_1483424 [Tanacetum coccineum]